MDSNLSTLLAVRTKLKPFLKKTSAKDLPIPAEAPVISTVLFFTFISILY